MPIDFHDPRNAHTYDTRAADPTWVAAISAIVSLAGKRVLDIGCGGGVYSRAFAELGAASVTGVDFSAAMLESARALCADLPQVTFQQGDALATGLLDACADLVYERALLHHLADLPACAAEAYRLLAPGGLYLAQDRTPDDIQLPATTEHLRAYFHERYPRLLEVELRRRPRSEDVLAALRGASLAQIETRSIWETRRVYATFDELADDLRQRVDRSILHELSDAELADLIEYIRKRLPEQGPYPDVSRWTLWWGVKSA
ncbi:MAG TPA: class I SAM-dependent methyltransferase [Ktedonobacterales bacterium]|jgi:ubiquinone/menaquinone biosynthesis C-methylase UbiE